jgi:hypothetical protein
MRFFPGLNLSPCCFSPLFTKPLWTFGFSVFAGLIPAETDSQAAKRIKRILKKVQKSSYSQEARSPRDQQVRSPSALGSAVSQGSRKCGLREEKEVRSLRVPASAVSECTRKCGLPGDQQSAVSKKIDTTTTGCGQAWNFFFARYACFRGKCRSCCIAERGQQQRSLRYLSHEK